MTDEELIQVKEMIDKAVNAAISNERKQKHMEYAFVNYELSSNGTTYFSDYDDKFKNIDDLNDIFVQGWQIKSMHQHNANVGTNFLICLERPSYLKTL